MCKGEGRARVGRGGCEGGGACKGEIGVQGGGRGVQRGEGCARVVVACWGLLGGEGGAKGGKGCASVVRGCAKVGGVCKRGCARRRVG